MAKIAVYHQGWAQPIYRKRRVAQDLVARGIAEVIDDKSIRIIDKPPVAPSSNLLKGSGQRKAYELAAIDCAPSFCQGGLSSGKRRQLRPDMWSGAKVGHQ